ncbi:MAG TPA: hypothetical protein DHW61_06295 [Lachnoclostridium phytofermentans]|uniref:Uncharacterized protein n=1 Tax=Lachnoclostridium phytofermentans TaxID=66219 RepID=A0A3D2X4W9_9FIRM|nr:hypothetical protein [Lachnoclostridium sp.]HCL02016.1 hypothetical protein [Lachnoclostridium phytofermentans]
MKVKIHKRIIIAILLVVCVVGGIIGKIGWDKLKIEEPIYFRYLVEHYLPTIVDSMELKYVQDFTDKRKVKEVEFTNHPELKVEVYPKYTQHYGIYKVITETIYMKWDTNVVSNLPDVAEIDSIQVTYSDGTKQIVDIGRICIYGGKSDRDILEAVDCIPLWESERMQKYKATETIIMEGLSELSHEFLQTKDIIESYSLVVDDDNITNGPCVIKPGQMVVFSMRLNGFDVRKFINSNSNYDYCKIVPQLIYQKESGEVFTTDIYNDPMIVQFENYQEVREYVKKRSVL